MKRFLKYIVVAIIAIVAVSCEVGDMHVGDLEGNIKPRPTTPIKRRPIVPTAQLPRPRVADCDLPYITEDELLEE
jgi:hypothetical protein